MNKTAALAALLLAACAADPIETSVGPERGDEAPLDGAARVTGRATAEGRVVLGNDAWVRATETVNGGFAFADVPDGTYFVKLEAAGVASPTQTVTVEGGEAKVALTASPLTAREFSYEWQRDLTRGGHEQGSAIGSARTLLRSAYGIELSDEELVWSDEHAARLLATMRAVPQPASSLWAPAAMTPTTYILSTDSFARGDDATVRVPVSAFGTGTFVSARLHQAIVSDVTDHGSDRAAVDRILLERYGVRAWLFSDAEMVALIGMLEDMPERLHAIPALRTIIRRDRGVAVRATVADAYLEIGEIAFRMDPAEAQYNLIREKARFLATPALQTACDCDVATAVADHIMQGGATVTGLDLETKRPIRRVAISTEGLRATVELDVTASSAAMYLFNEDTLGYSLLSLNPTADGVRGSVTLPRAGSWRPDVIIVRDHMGGVTVRDLSEVGWQLEVK